jgi:hypothetical protein
MEIYSSYFPGASTIFAHLYNTDFSISFTDRIIQSAALDSPQLNLYETVLRFDLTQTVIEISILIL